MTINDITILKFQEIQAAIEMNPDNEIAQWYNILPLFTDKTKEDYKQMKFTDFQKVIKKFEWLNSFQMPDEWVKSFHCGDELFYVTQEVTEWNTEQFISMSNLTKDSSQIINNLHLILATLCYKVKGEDVQLDEFDRRAKLFQDNLSIVTAYPIGFFFALVNAKLSTSTKFFSIMKRLANRKAKAIGSGRSGVGMQS